MKSKYQFYCKKCRKEKRVFLENYTKKDIPKCCGSDMTRIYQKGQVCLKEQQFIPSLVTRKGKGE